MALCDPVKITTSVVIGILLSSVITAALDVTGGSTDTNTITGGSTGTYSSAQNQGGSGGGGGGGGGGLSGENFTNIELNEKYYLYISKDKVTSYRFTGSGNPVLFVNITGNTSPGEIRTSVEVLRETSTLVKEPAPGMVYKNANIWVGTSGFAIPANIKEAVIRFRVEKVWISRNGLSNTDIRMCKWDGNGWSGLETDAEGNDETYSYFEARTESFSSFAISGLKNTDIAAGSKTVSNPAMTGTPQVPVATRTEKSPGFEIAIVITMILVAYLPEIVDQVGYVEYPFGIIGVGHTIDVKRNRHETRRTN